MFFLPNIKSVYAYIIILSSSFKSKVMTYFPYCYALCFFSCKPMSWESSTQVQFFLYFYSLKSTKHHSIFLQILHILLNQFPIDFAICNNAIGITLYIHCFAHM